MANQRYEVLSVRKYKAQDGSEKSAWTNIGVAFEQKDGKGFSVNLHCIPAPDKETGEYRIVMRIPMPKDDRQQGGGGQRREPAHDAGGGGGDFGDIPFNRVGDIG